MIPYRSAAVIPSRPARMITLTIRRFSGGSASRDLDGARALPAWKAFGLVPAAFSCLTRGSEALTAPWPFLSSGGGRQLGIDGVDGGDRVHEGRAQFCSGEMVDLGLQ